MTDITMCTNTECPLSWSCRRIKRDSSSECQSYHRFEYTEDKVLDEVECKFYLKHKGRIIPDEDGAL